MRVVRSEVYLCRTFVGAVGELEDGCDGNWWHSKSGKMVGKIAHGIPCYVGSWLPEHAQGWIYLHIHARHKQVEERAGVPRGD